MHDDAYTSTPFVIYFRPEEYKKKVSEYVRKYASEEALRQAEATAVSSSSESSMSDFSEDEAQVRAISNFCISRILFEMQQRKGEKKKE